MNNQVSTNEKRITRFQFPPLVEEDTGVVGRKIEELMHVSLEITAQLGKTTLNISEVLNLDERSEEIDLNDLGSEERKKYLIELDRQVGEPITLLINGRPFATGEVISSQEGDNYRIRIVSVISEEGGIDDSDKSPELDI